jgi:hypothetical protein
MFKLPVRTWILNAAAVLSRQHGAVTSQADDSQCSRETVYEHARKVEQRLDAQSAADTELGELRAENRRLRQQVTEHEHPTVDSVPCDKAKQRELAITAFAMGLSLRQIEELLGILLPEAKVPDHSTLGHWVQAEAQRAGVVLGVLDAACTSQVRTLAVDEIFFGGARLWSASSRPV